MHAIWVSLAAGSEKAGFDWTPVWTLGGVLATGFFLLAGQALTQRTSAKQAEIQAKRDLSKWHRELRRQAQWSYARRCRVHRPPVRPPPSAGSRCLRELPTKTEAGERVLPLPSKAADALKKFRARQARERLSAGEGYADSGYVTVNPEGEPMNTRHLREHAYRLMRELELRRVRLYDARHSCLTYLAVSGVPDVVLAAWAGHTNAAFTKAKYVQPNVEDLRAAATVWDTFHSVESPVCEKL
ncbi:tyrosine-type recombinase/integrase [Streptomyces sp. NPDC058992]|uniref:tyrosine-type recombinase/integrase n=1 Tax=Streptomyces sp. NPDC058992 TaxID=3346688 RepID=UPI0036BE3A1C